MTQSHQTGLSEVTGDEFTLVMRRFAASVNVITSADSSKKSGMTATAVCSVSADPPSALIVVNRSNRSHPVIAGTGAFAVNVLSSNQQHIASHFASKAPDPFADIPHSLGKTGCPIIDGADAYIECTVINQTSVGTHTIFVGKIVAAHAANGEPLLYHEGRYVGLGSEAVNQQHRG